LGGRYSYSYSYSHAAYSHAAYIARGRPSLKLCPLLVCVMRSLVQDFDADAEAPVVRWAGSAAVPKAGSVFDVS